MVCMSLKECIRFPSKYWTPLHFILTILIFILSDHLDHKALHAKSRRALALFAEGPSQSCREVLRLRANLVKNWICPKVKWNPTLPNTADFKTNCTRIVIICIFIYVTSVTVLLRFFFTGISSSWVTLGSLERSLFRSVGLMSAAAVDSLLLKPPAGTPKPPAWTPRCYLVKTAMLKVVTFWMINWRFIIPKFPMHATHTHTNGVSTISLRSRLSPWLLSSFKKDAGRLAIKLWMFQRSSKPVSSIDQYHYGTVCTCAHLCALSDPCPNPSLDFRPVALATVSCIRSRPWRGGAGLGCLPAPQMLGCLLKQPGNNPQSRSSIEFMTVVRLFYDFLTCLSINGAFPWGITRPTFTLSAHTPCVVLALPMGWVGRLSVKVSWWNISKMKGILWNRPKIPLGGLPWSSKMSELPKGYSFDSILWVQPTGRPINLTCKNTRTSDCILEAVYVPSPASTPPWSAEFTGFSEKMGIQNDFITIQIRLLNHS